MYNDSQKKMEKALQLIKEEGLSFRDAAGQCAIPKSTIYDHFAGNVKGYKRGPATVLTEAEENMLANWAVEMVKIGYGRTRQQITEMVKAILDKDGRPNPFSDNRPGKDWWYGFLRRHPNLTMRSPEQLQVSRASACSKQRLDKWNKDFDGFLKEHDELYNVWSKLKALTLHDDVQEDLGHNDSEDDPFDLGGQGQISEAFKESLVIPKSIVGTKKKTRGPSTMPPHISGDEVIQLMEEKLEKKKCDEDLKKKRREEKQEKQRVKEAEKKRREYKVKKKCKKDQEVAKIIECPVCYRGDDEEGNWICCNLCDTWYHTECVDIPQSEHFLLKEDDWYCHKCIDN